MHVFASPKVTGVQNLVTGIEPEEDQGSAGAVIGFQCSYLHALYTVRDPKLKRNDPPETQQYKTQLSQCV